ncbi:DMT family transporter [Marinivivus vitaminiproducens]|uniref:DMT family transporter n=1 Tax=Marinivivus vitaminiproducens TaxID=3035935 RepID=UPI003FA18CF5
MDSQARAWLNGFVGMLIFSGSLPAMRAAVLAFDPVFLTLARASLAGLLATGMLLLFGRSWPSPGDLVSLGIVVFGVVIGFPLLTALALSHVTAAHATVFLGLLPMATTLFSVVRGEAAPRPIFWAFAVTGAVLVSGYALRSGFTASPVGDLLMAASIVVCGLGYAEGARLSRTLGGWQVTAWALVLALPLMLPLAVVTMPASVEHVGAPAWLGLAYVSVFSMIVGFVFWYRGLALGGIATVGQLQLLQPFFGLALAALLLGETVDGAMIAVSAAVALCVAGVRRYGTAPGSGAALAEGEKA